jgi:DNA-binding response OmpR family regulator
MVPIWHSVPGLDGKALAREALRRLPGISVAYVTGNPECFDRHSFTLWERLVAKPFAGDDLFAAVRAIRPADRRRGGTAAPEHGVAGATAALEFA